MKVGIFTDTYSPDINGVVTSIVTLKKALEARGHEVFIVANQPSLLKASYEDRILRLPGVELRFLYGYTLSSPLHFQAMKIVESMDLDIIHAQSEFGVGIFARMAAKNLHLPLISTYHTTYEDYTHYINLLGLKVVENISRRAVAKMSRMYSKSSQIVIAPSQKTKEMLEGYNIDRNIVVIPTGLDLDRFHVHDEKKVKEIRKEYQLEDKTVFIYVGRLAKEKSVDIVLNCFAGLSKETNTVLLIVGDGPSKEDLEDQAEELAISDRVIFTGKVKAEDIAAYYHAADLFVSASLTETQGLTYIEALACGLCVMARPDEPLQGIIVEGETGFFFDDPASFARKAMAYLAKSKEDQSHIRTNALNMAERFSLDVFGKAVEEVYEQSIDMYYGLFTIKEIRYRDDDVLLVLSHDNITERVFVSHFVFERRQLKEGLALSRNELNEIEEDECVYEAFQKALSKIAVKDYTSYEMKEFLISKYDLREEQQDVIIDLLKRRKFIDDSRYLQDKIDYHRFQLHGNQRILDDLVGRGLDRSEVENALMQEDEASYYNRGLQRAERFIERGLRGSFQQQKTKLSQHLIRQGYEIELANRMAVAAIGEVDGEEEKEELSRILRKQKRSYERKYDGDDLKQKLIHYGLQKGYSYDLIREIMEDIQDEN